MAEVVKLGNKVYELRDWNPSGIAQQVNIGKQPMTSNQPSSEAGGQSLSNPVRSGTSKSG